MPVCVCLCFYMVTGKIMGESTFKLEHVVVYGNSLGEFDIVLINVGFPVLSRPASSAVYISDRMSYHLHVYSLSCSSSKLQAFHKRSPGSLQHLEDDQQTT